MNTQRVEGHTPTPYHTDDYHRYIWGPDQQMIADTPDDVDRYVLRMRGVGARLPIEANAAFIVHACNNIERLEKVNEALLAAAELAFSYVSRRAPSEIVESNLKEAIRLAKEPA